jgi:CelD/BcsL family acetyltransferase involved in cellulose biosynthesis
VASPENLFATEEWLETWWSHFGRDRPRVGDGLLYETRRFPVRVLRLVGAGISDMAPVEPERLQELLASERWDVFVGEAMPTGSGELLAGRVLRRHSSPVVRFAEGSWDEFLAARSPNFRSQVRRRERKLLEEHALGFRLSGERNGLAADLDTLFALHRARWPHGSSSFGWNERVLAFHREFAPLAFDRGWLRLWFLEAGGKPVAAWYGFRFGGVEHYYQAGRDPAWEPYSVGFVLLAHTIRTALEDGMQAYRMLLGGEDFKRRFTTEDPGVETVALTRGAVARIGLALADARRRRRAARAARSSAPPR